MTASAAANSVQNCRPNLSLVTCSSRICCGCG